MVEPVGSERVPEPPDNLVNTITNNAGVIFAGSGLSLDAGAPSWAELILELIYVAENRGARGLMDALACHYRGELQHAADITCRAIADPAVVQETVVTAMEWDHTIERVPFAKLQEALLFGRGLPWLTKRGPSRERNLRPTACHRILTRLRPKVILTTNYDRLFERAVGTSDIASYTSADFRNGPPVRGWDRFILHLHGDVHRRTQIAVSSTDCADLTASKAYDYVSALVIMSATLWVGYSVSDLDIEHLLKSNLRSPQDYLLVTREDFGHVYPDGTTFAERLSKNGIQPLLIDDYRDVESFLRKLEKAVGTGPKPETGVDSHLRVTNYFAVLNTRSQAINKGFQSTAPANLPLEYVTPTVCDCRSGNSSNADALLHEWSRRRGGRRVALTAAPAAGKSVLLARFSEHLQRRFEAGDPVETLAPLVLLLTADSIPDPITTLRSFWEQVEARANAATGEFKTARRGLLYPWLETRSVYLLFDGLDEFGARRSGDLPHLLDALAEASASYGISVFLSCREVFWSHQVPETEKAKWEQFAVQPFTMEQIEGVLGEARQLIPFAFQNDRPRPGVLNHLVAGFAVTLWKDRRHTQNPFPTSFALFQAWSEHETRRFQSVVSWERWLRMFRGTALKLLRDLALSTGMPLLDDGSLVPFHECFAMNVLVRAADGGTVKFYHESLLEFFMAWALADSFRAVVQRTFRWQDGIDLALGQVDLDFPQSSFYGCVNEALGQDYLALLLGAFDRIGTTEDPRLAKLMRNLVEYVGMCFHSSPSPHDVIDFLFRVAEHTKLDGVIRYNAVRALERIHPWAPRPYFSYMSDYGGRDWSRERAEAKDSQLCPWIMRGYRVGEGGIETRRPKRKPPFAVCGGGELPHEQKGVSLRLAKLLRDEVDAPTVPENVADGEVPLHDALLINLTGAWARWYHPCHEPELKELREFVRDRGARAEAIENLEKWVGHPDFLRGSHAAAV